jgi:hypothetical protein
LDDSPQASKANDPERECRIGSVEGGDLLLHQDREGNILARGKVASDPEALVAVL